MDPVGGFLPLEKDPDPHPPDEDLRDSRTPSVSSGPCRVIPDPVLDPRPPVPPDPVLCSGSPGSSVFSPATVQLTSPVDKPSDEISVGSAFDSAPAAALEWSPYKVTDPAQQLDLRCRPPESFPQLEPSSVPPCASQRPPVPLSASQHLSAPACPPACLLPCQPVASSDVYHRPRLRSSRRRLRPARKPPGGNSRRLPRLRQDS
jgi:hypothetical protein